MKTGISTQSHALAVNSVVDQYVNRVNGYIQVATGAWLDAATTVYDAKCQLNSAEYQVFLQRINFTNSVANKLLKIAESRHEIEQYFAEHLNAFIGWSPLYEVSKLTSRAKLALAQTLISGQHKRITRKIACSYQSNKSAKPASQTLATIDISYDCLDVLTSFESEAIVKVLTDIQEIISRTGLSVISLDMHPEIMAEVKNRAISTLQSDATSSQGMKQQINSSHIYDLAAEELALHSNEFDEEYDHA